jgi:TrmH family RNA methyltransferase
MITSNQNSKIKNLYSLQNKSKLRKKEGKFIVEGKKILDEVPLNRIVEIYITEEFQQKEREYIEKLREHVNVEIVSVAVFKFISSAVTPQGILGVITIQEIQFNEIKSSKNTLYIAVENMQDPGNIGTIIRTADAVNACVILSKGSVDIYNPKVVRATMGSLFRVPILTNADLSYVIKDMKNIGIKVYAAHLKGEKYHYDLDLKKPTCFLIGNEGNGLSYEIANLATEYIKIPILGKTESLNASIAAGVLLYEAIRQRMN